MIPDELRWGNRRFLRCGKVDSDGRISPPHRVSAGNSDQRRRSSNCTLHPLNSGGGKRERGREIDSHGSRKFCRPSPPASDTSSGYDGEGIAATRERVILDLQNAAEEMKEAIFKEREVYKSPPPAAAASVESESSRPWNLRTRRADLKTSMSRFEDKIAAVKEPMTNTALIEKPMRLRSESGAAASGGKKERRKFAVALRKREIEEDFYSLVGRRPPGRPKKRNRNVQKQLDELFPGLGLSEVTPNMYKVADG